MLYILFPIFAVLPVVINGIATHYDRRHNGALTMALMILTIWGVQRIIAAYLPIPDRQSMNPMFDLMAGLAALGCWLNHRSAWAVILANLYALQCVLAANFWWKWEVMDLRLGYTDYLVANNVLWLLQLVCVSSAGGVSVARRIVDHLRSGAHSRNHLGAAT